MLSQVEEFSSPAATPPRQKRQKLDSGSKAITNRLELLDLEELKKPNVIFNKGDIDMI